MQMADDDAADRRDAAEAHVPLVGLAALDVRLDEVGGDDRVERAHVRRHAGHERRHQAGQGDPEHAVGQVLVHQQRDRVVVLQVARRRRARGSRPARSCPAGSITNGMNSFGKAPISGVARRGGQVLGRQRALDLGEVRRPVAEREHEAEAEDDRRSRSRRSGWSTSPARVPCSACRPASPSLEPRSCPAARSSRRRRRSADDRERHQRREDHEELQHLVVDRRREAAERDVGEHDDRGDDDADDDRPAEQHLQDQRERVQVHAGDQDRARARTSAS